MKKQRERKNVMWFRDGSALFQEGDGFAVRERTDTSRQREFERLCAMYLRRYMEHRNRYAFWRKWL